MARTIKEKQPICRHDANKTDTLIRPTPSTSSPTSFRFIRYNKHTPSMACG